MKFHNLKDLDNKVPKPGSFKHFLRIQENGGRIVKGVNTTVDVGPNEITKQAAKFGFKVDKDGRPATLSKKVKGSKTNVLFNLGMAESKNNLVDNNTESVLQYSMLSNLSEAKLGELASASEIYVDMDGVLADFFGEWAKLMKVDHYRKIDNIDINVALASYHLAFFPPKNVYITNNKPQYATNKDGTPNILVDDFGKNVASWEAAGGIGFKYKDHKFERTAKELKQHIEEPVEENFADGKKPGRKGLAKRSGVNTKASVSDLRKTAKNSSGEKQRMAHWMANMKAGRKKAKG